MARIGIYGGTFNPPHRGHIEAAKQAMCLLELDRLLLIPDRQPPHKELGEGDPNPWERLELVKLASSDLHNVEVSDIELNREGKSYTSDTVTALREQYPEDELFLIMGTDMFQSFHTWHEPGIICAQAELCVLLRDRSDKGLMAQLAEQTERLSKEFGGRVRLLDNPIVPMSSTNVRRMLAFRAPGDMVPAPAMERILERGYYRCKGEFTGLSMEELAKEATALLDPKRVPHVLGCAETAKRLAIRYGADPVAAERAGLLHDVTKALPPELQLQLCDTYGLELDAFSRQNPKTLHALTGAAVAQRIFGESPEVVEAICSHTTGCRNMNTLQMIIYIADYMEPNRDFPGVELLRAATERSLEEAVYMGLEMTVDLLHRQGRSVCRDSLDAMEWLRSKQ